MQGQRSVMYKQTEISEVIIRAEKHDRKLAREDMDGDGQPLLNEKNARIILPENGQVYLYQDVTNEDVAHLSKLDGIIWRAKGKKDLLGGYVKHSFYAETDVPGVSTSEWKKHMFLDTKKKIAFIQYEGDNR